MIELYPLLFAVISFVVGIFVFGYTKKDNSTQPQYAVTTEGIDKLIHNSNSGVDDICYKQVLGELDINYIAWKVNRNVENKQQLFR